MMAPARARRRAGIGMARPLTWMTDLEDFIDEETGDWAGLTCQGRR
jgi:hypothetical protein